MTTPARNTVAIDPMKLLLTDSAYLKWVEGHNPHTPSGKEIEQFVGRLSWKTKRRRPRERQRSRLLRAS